MDIGRLIEAVKRHEAHSLDALMPHTAPLIRYIIAPILKSPQEEEECLADITMLIWNKIESYDAALGSWNGWVTTLARNTALNRARSMRRLIQSDDLTEDIPSPLATPEESLFIKERRDAVRRALQGLSERDQILIYRKYYYLQSTAQIAAEFGVTERAVEGRLYRLKQRLRTLLGGEEHE